MSVGKTLTIARRELGTYFNSPVAYIVISAYLVASGALYFLQVFLIKEATLRDFFAVQPLLFIFFAPAISMRLLAEEKRSGTVAMLFTLPLDDWDVVIGKFLAAMSVMGVGVLLTLAYPITISRLGPLDWGATIAGYVGLLMMGGAYIGIGLMASSWTKNQIRII